jgi:hypothetical protein
MPERVGNDLEPARHAEDAGTADKHLMIGCGERE